MDALPSAVLPNAGVRFEIEAARLLPQVLQISKEADITHARQPPVDEHLRGAENDAAVGIMLHLLRCQISDAHRTHAEKARRSGAICSSDRIIVHDAVHGT